MRLVLDTNVAVAGLLWNGHPRHLLDLAIDETVALFCSPALLDELTRTLHYLKLAKRIEQCQTTPPTLAVHYSALVILLSPIQVPRVIENDADDDQVLACAVAAQADLIVSGDKHLLSLGGQYQGISIVTPAQAVAQIGK
ncbi:MAG: putative toxin-antitoxin system toxin component, PIN family [Betaproteobacteria bacterium]|nr:putative toxin-antitoxin system toxin component, PIN family [Betaproteobacteria bacterium]